MQLYLAGGVGEHGRNCFYVKGEELAFLLDCGKHAGAEDPYPDLSDCDVAELDFVLLTHAHGDHAAALPWLERQGFHGAIVAAAETLEQIRPLELESDLVDIAEWRRLLGLDLTCGKSGHCVGSLWFELNIHGHRLLYSGDYNEHSPVYAVDPIRGKITEMAVLDTADHAREQTVAAAHRAFVLAALEALEQGPLLLPVPEYGRGLELLYLLREADPSIAFFGDRFFRKQLAMIDRDAAWFKEDALALLRHVVVEPVSEIIPERAVLFLADSQMQRPEYAVFYKAFVEFATILLTGTVYPDTPAHTLVSEGLVRQVKTPVHQSAAEMEALAAKNDFEQVIGFHAPTGLPEERHYSY